MAKTEVRSGQVKDGTVGRSDMDIATAGEAVITKLVAGTGVVISAFTGADSGTGDVTVAVSTKLQAFHALANAVGVLTNDGAGNLSWNTAGTGTVTGTGTTGTIPKWSSASGLTDSAITETAGTVTVAGIATFASPSGASATSNYLNITATVPNLSAQFRGINFDLTEQASGSQTMRAFHLTVNPAATSPNGTIIGGNFATASRTSGIAFGIAASSTQTDANGVGTRIGVGGSADDGDLNYGVYGESYDLGTYSYGVVGNSEGVGTNGAGGLFQIGVDWHSTTHTPPTARAALIANSVGTFPIMIGLNDGVEAFRFSDTGNLTLTNGALADTASVFTVTATLNTAGPSQIGAAVTITGAGSGTSAQVAMQTTMAAGYTGSSSTTVLGAVNFSAATGAGLVTGDFNTGLAAQSRGTTTGTNVGSSGIARGGNINVGIFGRATIAKNSATNIGMVGIALNTGTTPIHVGGYFGLVSATPTFVSAALVADNGTTTDPIFLARDNGTTVLTVADGGAVTTTGSLGVGGAFGCNSATPQTAYASGGALAAYGAGANGFDTAGNASALHAMVVALRAALVANGIMS